MNNGSADPLLGKQIGGSKLLASIAKSSFATVYLAEHPDHGHTQLCILSEDVSEDEDALKRYFGDLAKIASLNHAHVRRVYRAEIEHGVAYVELEHFDAQTLSSILKDKGCFPIPESMILFRDMCAGLKAAHQLGLIKRSLSPDSFLLLENGTVKVHDFGQLASNMGSPEHMSPEQCSGKELDQRSDIYSLGAVFYQLITGRKLFSGDTVMEVMQKHIEEAPLAPHVNRAEIPLALSQLLTDMLQKSPAARPQSIEAVEERLSKIAYRDSPEFLAELQKEFTGPFTLLEIVDDKVETVICRGQAQSSEKDIPKDSVVDLTLVPKDASSELKASLEAEAALLSPVRHKHIGQIYRFVSDGSMPYRVAEKIESRLSSLIHSGMILDEQRALNIIKETALALGELHRAGVMHGDVTPESIGFDSEDRVKLTEFGVAKRIDQAAARPGFITGTPHYMAPEACAALPKYPVSPVSDIYSLGVVFFELVSGQKPFQGSTIPEIFLQHMEKPAPAANIGNPDLSQGTVNLIANMLAKRPENRYQSVEDLEKDLSEVLDHRPIAKHEKLNAPISMGGGGCLGTVLLMVTMAAAFSVVLG
ncbi:MAG: serine/threonine-protein kinase [Planctomycetota bacterium]|nr:serine/threonine-protein kinase [Planctomycetota bacterium]